MASSKLYTYRLAMALFALTAMASGLVAVLGSDEDPLQDFCVAITDGKTPTINGFPCKPVGDTDPKDFKSSLLAKPGSTDNKNKAFVNTLNVAKFAGLNTQGISAARIDFAAGGLNPPHVHPRATELLFLVKGGPLEVGFVTTANADGEVTLFQQDLYEGDVFVFPRGLLHFQKNRGDKPAFALAALNSQNPGAQQAAVALFAAKPKTISSDVLQQTLRAGDYTVQQLIEAQSK